ncbi:transferrin-like [Anticarsia gemmatalis]|uniref:transferrin-like n=1 Tax=Anticarsia gemmatalis TaxID=129554 RepID=UPI003F7728EA
MVFKMCVRVFFSVLFCLHCVLAQGTGSGKDGNLRLCIVEGRGSYKRAPTHCPILDQENAGVECVVGTDRLDCLRRISKGTVDFGVFSPEDLVAAQWANIDVLVTNEVRFKNRPFNRRIVAVVNKRILPDSSTSLHAILKNTTLCHPGDSMDELKPLSETLSGYLETLVLERSCDPTLSDTENKLKALSEFYGKACKAGPWVPDKDRDMELKMAYPSLCAACGYRSCSAGDPYWGSVGSLTCLTEGTGDVTWGDADDISSYFKLKGIANVATQNFAYLCRDGTWRDLTQEPCVWLQRPWNIIVAKRKAAEAVSRLAESLTNRTVTVDHGWRGALAALLECNQALPHTLQPAKTALDYLARADGFREAYSQNGCDPPRHITLCTTSTLARNKCEWLSEAAAVYGIAPALQCALRNSAAECLATVAAGHADVAVASSDFLVPAARMSLTPVLHEITQIAEKTNTIVAYVNSDAKLTKMADLRGKRAAFPRYDGVAWHSVKRYVTEKENITCGNYINSYFKEICAPGMDGKKCYEAGEEEALKWLVDGKTDVAFVSMNTFNSFKTQSQSPNINKTVPLCPEDNKKYCSISWSNLGHIFAANNITEVRKHEIINVFRKMDQIFGKHPPFHNAMFSMYGAYNHEMEVIFHSNTKTLATSAILKHHPFDKIPYNFELTLEKLNLNETCSFGVKVTPSIVVLMITLVAFLINRY